MKETVNGTPIVGLLGLLFIALKLTGVIHWSWWWVLIPFWGPIAAVLGIALIAVIIFLITRIIG